MEPELPAPRMNPEHSPAAHNNKTGENLSSGSMEWVSGQSAERYEQRSESTTKSESAAVSLPMPVMPSPVPDDTAVSDDSKTNNSDDLPETASDDDLIENVWVDKAKQILARTKDDPYAREQEMSRLQIEYLKKRYGKELETSS